MKRQFRETKRLFIHGSRIDATWYNGNNSGDVHE